MTTHEALRSDFYEIVRQFVGAATATVVADRLVHVTVLHGLLPELDEKPAPARCERPAGQPIGGYCVCTHAFAVHLQDGTCELCPKVAAPKTSYLADLEVSADMASSGGRPVLQLDEYDAVVYAEAFRLAEATDRFLKLWGATVNGLANALVDDRATALHDLQAANARMMGARVSRVGAARMRAPR